MADTRFTNPTSVQIEGAGRKWLPLALQLMDVTVRRRSASGLTMSKGYLRLSDGAYAYAVSVGGMNVVRIVSDEESEAGDYYPVPLRRPDFVSGYVADGTLDTVRDREGVRKYCRTFRPTIDCARLFKLKTSPQSIQKLAVKLYTGFDEFEAPEGSIVEYTQYVKMHATWYSGTMVKLVQLLMGFGRQKAKSSIYGKQTEFVDDEDGDGPPGTTTNLSPYERDVLADGLRIRFDYRWTRTHGLTRASDGKWWIIEIGITRGIVAMPLLLHEDTTTVEFAELLEKMNDPAGQAALETFGGFPTGECLPSHSQTFNAWERAGRIVRLAPREALAEFYECDFYSSAMGWAFNAQGSEAHNTGWTIDESDGCQRGLHYAVNLSVAVAAPLQEQSGAAALRANLADMRAKEPLTFDANMFKTKRLTALQLRTLGQTFNEQGKEACYAALDAMTVAPLATGNAVPRVMSRGKIYWPSKYQPQIKFPEPLLGYLVSHDMRPDRRQSVEHHCDTTMHVFFAQDQLRFCKFYNSPKRAPSRRDGDDPFDIQWNPVGNFYETYTTGPIGIPAMFYTGDFDDRAALGTMVEDWRYQRQWRGWEGIGSGGVAVVTHFSYSNVAGPLDPDFNEGGADENHKLIIGKWKRMRMIRDFVRINAPSLGAAIAVPFNDRQAYYYATMKGHNGRQFAHGDFLGALASPWIGHWYRQTGTMLTMVPQRHIEIDSPYGHFQDLADEGDWVPHGTPASSVANSRVPWIEPEKYTMWSEGESKTLNVQLITSGMPGPIQSYTETRTKDAALWDSWWFLPSPDPDTGLTAYIAEGHNGWGPTDCVVADQTMNTPGVGFKKHGFQGFPEFHPGMTFVGWV